MPPLGVNDRLAESLTNRNVLSPGLLSQEVQRADIEATRSLGQSINESRATIAALRQQRESELQQRVLEGGDDGIDPFNRGRRGVGGRASDIANLSQFIQVRPELANPFSLRGEGLRLGGQTPQTVQGIVQQINQLREVGSVGDNIGLIAPAV